MEQQSSPVLGPTSSPSRKRRKSSGTRRKSSRFRKLSMQLSIKSLRSDDKSATENCEKSPNLLQLFLNLCPCLPKKKFYEKGRILMVKNAAAAENPSELYFQSLPPDPDMDLEKTQTTFEPENQKPNKFSTSKYTKLTFLPVNLYGQFRRIANVYFLLSLIMAFAFKDYAPISPVSWMTNLVFLVVVTMAKQGYEDYLRHQSDK